MVAVKSFVMFLLRQFLTCGYSGSSRM